MKSRLIAILTISLAGCIPLHTGAQTSASSILVAQPIPDRSANFSLSDTGTYKPFAWGLDGAWNSITNVRRGVLFMGAANVDLYRCSFQPIDTLVNDDLTQARINDLNYRLYLASFIGPHVKLTLNCDHPSVNSWYLGNAQRWAKLMDATLVRVQNAGRTVVSIAPFNEPDYGWGQFSGNNGKIDFFNICGELRNNPHFDSIRISGGNTLSADQAAPWYNYLKTRLDEGNTHQLAGSFNNFAAFFQQVRNEGKFATGDELHNVGEALVGYQYGMQAGIWWGAAELARGELASAFKGRQLGYAEHRPNWTAAAVFRNPAGKVQGFLGSSERQAANTTYRFVSLDKDVYFDGYGPQREYMMQMPGGTGYQTGQTNAERVVNITYGEDIQPVINGTYKLVNRNSGKVLVVAGGGLNNSDSIQQASYSGLTSQQWSVIPVSTRVGGDYSYMAITAVHSGKVLDNSGNALDNGTRVVQWTNVNGRNQQWYLDYAGDNWFYIRNRFSSKCLDVSMSSTAENAYVQQWAKTGGNNQQWRLLPINAPIEFVAPAVPVNVTATARPTSVLLSWTASSETDVTGYTIFRSEMVGGPFNTIARNIAGTSFVDNTATLASTYIYKIKAVDQSLNCSDYSAQATATPTGTDTLVAYWPFNSSLLDSTINLNHSAAYASPAYTAGKVGSGAVVLNGTTNFVQLPATIANLPEMTVATWVNWNGGSNWQRIFDFGNSTTENIFLAAKNTLGQIQFGTRNGTSPQNLTGPALPTGVWAHLAVTIGAGSIRLYLNGTMVNQLTGNTFSPLDLQPVSNYIGRSQWATDPLFSGLIDEFKIFNYALSDAEVQALANLTILPVRWESFTAEKNGNTSRLTWSTLTEHNVASFLVERSADGIHFSSIGTVKAVGESNTRQTYWLTDAIPVEGANYYRIRQTDKDGKAAYSAIKVLSFSGLPPVVTITPNPAKNFITISIPGNRKSLLATLVDGKGQQIAAFILNGQTTTYDISKYVNGVYYLQLQGMGANVSRKIVIGR